MNKKTKNQSNKCTLYVEGMHCASCEILIEKKLLKEENVSAANASLSDNKVEIQLNNNEKLDIKKINSKFKNFGYKFSISQVKKNTPLIQFKNGGIVLNPQKAIELIKIFLVFVLILIGFNLFESLQLGKYASADTSSSLPTFIAVGVIAGISSCAALIGGILLSMIKQWNEEYIDSESQLEKLVPHGMFHVGRLLSFFIFGGLLGVFGKYIIEFFENILRSLGIDPIYVIAGIVIIISLLMVIIGLQMLGVRALDGFRIALPKSWSNYATNDSSKKGKFSPFLIGFMTFFIPCGITLGVQGIALASGSFITGALTMFFFAIGTALPLVAISFSGVGLNSKPHLTAKFNIVAGLLILFFVVYNINGQLNILGVPSLSDISFNFGSNNTDSAILEKNENGEQVLTMIAKGFAYTPTSATTINANTPTKLVVDNQGIDGCGAFMASKGLIQNVVQLEPGKNEIDLGSPSAGTYKITCAMGMVPPVTIRVL